jgi:hypothetical protein
LERNDVSMDVLLKCPALIDASSEEEVRTYLEPFMEAINFDPEKDQEIEISEVEELDGYGGVDEDDL